MGNSGVIVLSGDGVSGSHCVYRRESVRSTVAKSEDSELLKMEVGGKVQATNQLHDALLLRG